MRTLEKSPETVQIVPHPIRVGWTLLIAGEPISECFGHWAPDELSVALRHGAKHFATVEIPPSPAMLPTLADALRRNGVVYLQPAAA